MREIPHTQKSARILVFIVKVFFPPVLRKVNESAETVTLEMRSLNRIGSSQARIERACPSNVVLLVCQTSTSKISPAMMVRKLRSGAGCGIAV